MEIPQIGIREVNIPRVYVPEIYQPNPNLPVITNLEINTAEMDIGEHRLFTRFQDSDGNWAGAVSYPFTVVSPPIIYTPPRLPDASSDVVE